MSLETDIHHLLDVIYFWDKGVDKEGIDDEI